MDLDGMFKESIQLALFEQFDFPVYVYECAVCGALIHDTNKHFSYHQERKEVV